jgi:hypothetical protein
MASNRLEHSVARHVYWRPFGGARPQQEDVIATESLWIGYVGFGWVHGSSIKPDK